MIIDEKFIEYYKNATREEQVSTFNFFIYIYIVTGMKLKDRISIAIEIILGRIFSLWISKDQEK